MVGRAAPAARTNIIVRLDDLGQNVRNIVSIRVFRAVYPFPAMLGANCRVTRTVARILSFRNHALHEICCNVMCILVIVGVGLG